MSPWRGVYFLKHFFFFPFSSIELFRLSCRETSLSCETRHAPFLAALSSQKLPMEHRMKKKKCFRKYKKERQKPLFLAYVIALFLWDIINEDGVAGAGDRSEFFEPGIVTGTGGLLFVDTFLVEE